MLDILQAFLALAVTMLAMATLATVIIEFIARLTRRRFRVFAHLLRQLFEKELQPMIEDLIKAKFGTKPERLSHELARHRTTFLSEICNSPLDPEKDESKVSWFGGWLRLLGADSSTRLTTEEFVRRLARSEVGREVYQQAAGNVETVVDKISLRYEELMEAMREYVKSSSTILSILIGIILAFSLNVDALRLINFYLENPDAAKKVSDSANTYVEAYDEARKKLEVTLTKLDTTEPANATREEAMRELEEINRGFAQISEKAAKLEVQGIPIGTDYFPYCRYREKMADGAYPCLESEERFKASSFEKRLYLDYLLWLLRVLITGMMIGLGGPFWYDAVRGLMRTTQIIRGRDQPREPTPGAKVGETKPAKPAEIFEKHVEKTHIGDARWRPAGNLLPVKTKVYAGPRWRPPANNIIVADLTEGDNAKSEQLKKSDSLTEKREKSD